MYYFSLYRARYLKFSFLHVLAFLLTGPIAAARYGFIEIAVIYLVVLIIPFDPYHLLLFHGTYVLLGIVMFPILMKIRNYRRTDHSEIYGRFTKGNSVWP